MKSIQIFAALAAVVTLPFAVACGGGSNGFSTGSTSAASSADSCESEHDCTGFLPESVEVCSNGTSEAAHWECKKHSCEIAYCSASETTTASNSCESASECTGILPDSVEVCGNGSSAAAHWECTSHACVIGYCSSTSTGSGSGTSTGSGTGASNSCHSASDCSGLLPQSVEQCNDGTSQAAQWDCNAGSCVISYCDSDGGVGTGTGSGSGASNTCQSASDCNGLLPQSVEQCNDGTSQAAQWDCNAGSCVISYCDNDGGVGTGSGASNSCQSPSDCNGFLPQSYELCNDGTSSPAQWDCNAGSCVISYCDSDGGTAS